MRLTNLEIKGFKSFADRTVVNFTNDVIGIVGPNGCGKSNIVDAIRWVLGEQRSSALRSDKMENVIFNGTKDRKPSGAAEVSLTFENTRNLLPTEYHTVTIKRILYRTGDSEYRLNEVKCRLKDISNLLSDTGISSDSYAIIALGMVDDILNDKDGSRRRLFEQAAGISKYKSRKKETLSKLESTDADLSRVEDLLFEIDNNLKMLEKQAKRARKYFELKEEYKINSIELALLKLTDHKYAYRETEQQIRDAENALAEATAKVAEIEATLEKEKLVNLEQEKALSDKQRTLNALVGKIRNHEGDKKMLSQKDLFVKDNTAKLDSRIKSAEDTLVRTNLEIERFTEQLAAEKAIQLSLQAELEEARKRTEEIKGQHGNMKESLDKIIQEQQVWERKVLEREKEKAIFNSRRENTQREIQRSQDNLNRRLAEINTVQEAFAAEEIVKQEKLKLIEDLQQQETKRKLQLEAAEKEAEQYNSALQANHRLLDSRKHDYKLTKSMVESLEGFPESIRFLSKESGWKSDAKLLSDIIYCKEEYRVTIENFLENFLSYYIVHSAEDAAKAIHLLDSAKKGKAGFFILEAFADYVPPTPAIANGISALEVITVDKMYQNLIHYLLGNVYITEGALKEDVSAQRQSNEHIFLDVNGSFVKRRFSIKGGSVGLFEGKRIGRKKSLELLEKEIQELEGKTGIVQESLDKTRLQITALRKEALDGAIQRERNALDQVHRTTATRKAQLDSFAQFKTESEEKIKQMEAELAQLQTEQVNTEEQLITAKIDLEAVKQKLAGNDADYRSVSEQLSVASNNYNQKNIETIRQQNLIAGIERESSFAVRRKEEVSQQLAADIETRNQQSAEINQMIVDLQAIDKQLLQLYEEKKAFERTLTDQEQSYYKSRETISTTETLLRQWNHKRNDHQNALNLAQNKFSDLKLALTSLSERMKVEFDIRLNDIINSEPITGLTLEEVDQKVEGLRSRLQNYGEVNPMAVEAFDEMKTRYDFIQDQRKDLIDAKTSLLETMKEIEVAALTQFMATFNQVRTHFQEVFRSLFTEDDTCDLILKDTENPLESDIDIIAKPKGKRPLTINQLSGGEKTLTATALLFSLYLLKPAPFCIFDEVDAPLDDSNIAKFNNIIKKFSGNSQFIIVTHNKQTMASVDVIYGVTMQKQGISEVIPVAFSSLN